MILQCETGAQDRGSEVTYLRRYTLLNAAGVFPVDEDDDGAAAQKTKAKPKAKQNSVPGIATTYRVFLKTAHTQNDLAGWWNRNSDELDKLKDSHSDMWAEVVGEFSKRKQEIEALNNK
jgi:hypothetical protein